MVPAEVVVIVALLMFVASGGIAVYHSYLTRSAVGISIVAVLLLGWVGLAFLLPHPVVDVSYHSIVQEKMPDGDCVNIIAVTDDNGEMHVVNLDKALGESPPKDGHVYQVARIKYSGYSLGILFRGFRKYQIIPLK